MFTGTQPCAANKPAGKPVVSQARNTGTGNRDRFDALFWFSLWLGWRLGLLRCR
jgi:hypothetical protein